MTSLPDWLVERVALDEVPPASKARVDGADPAELADRVAALRAANEAELKAYPAGPAVDQIETRVAQARWKKTQGRRRVFALITVASVASLMIVGGVVLKRESSRIDQSELPEITRAKGAARVVAYRNAGDHPELLVEDALVKPGDVLQLRYKPEKAKYGVIASIDGAGEVTLHFPASETGSTALAKEPTSLPHSYALDDAPRFERFFFVTSDEPIDVPRTLDTLRAFAQRADSPTAELELPEGLGQWSLRLRKPEQKAPNQ